MVAPDVTVASMVPWRTPSAVDSAVLTASAIEPWLVGTPAVSRGAAPSTCDRPEATRSCIRAAERTPSVWTYSCVMCIPFGRAYRF